MDATQLQSILRQAQALTADRGQSLTPLRRQVYEQVLIADRPIGAYDLLALLEPQRGRMPPTTVYRALDFLVEAGLVHRIESMNAFLACHEIGEPHQGQFLVCERCSHVIEIPGDEAAKSVCSSHAAHGFELHKQVVELTGLCADCRHAPSDRGAGHGG